jgi:hypothetical protein
VRVTEAVAQRAQAFDNRSASTENALESFLRVLPGSELKLLGDEPIQAWNVRVIRVRLIHLGEDVLADALEKGARQRDGPFRIFSAPLQCTPPGRVNRIAVQSAENLSSGFINGASTPLGRL